MNGLRILLRRHPGLDPGSSFFSEQCNGSGTPGQARGDEGGADATAVLGAMDIVFGECDR